MRKILFLLPFAILMLFACQKEDPTLPPPPPPAEYVPIYSPCHTSMGTAEANKLTASWKAGASCRSVTFLGEKLWVLEMFTCTEDGLEREYLSIGGMPDSNPVQRYSIKNFTSSIIEGAVDPSYGTSQQDGDVLEDTYYIDTTATNDFVQIDLWDTVNKRAEGRFSVSFFIKEPRRNPLNPKKVRFTSGKFVVQLP